MQRDDKASTAPSKLLLVFVQVGFLSFIDSSIPISCICNFTNVYPSR